ncbi:MAG: transposase [Candidatus Helarchaeota archaeon]
MVIWNHIYYLRDFVACIPTFLFNSRLFDKWFRIDKYFEKYKKWHCFTYGEEKKKVYYKEATLYVSKIGCRKIFMFKEENEKKCRDYMASDWKISAKTTYRYIKRRWSVETMHRELKQFFGLKATYFRQEKLFIGTLNYLIFWLVVVPVV